MFKKTCSAIIPGFLALAVGLSGQNARADAVSDFYSGKRVTILVGFGSGGS